MRSLLNNITDAFSGKAPLGVKRSGSWPLVRSSFLKLNPKCAICESTTNLEVHHIKPFHLNPELELDVNNLITLCESKKYGITCHLLVGHLGNYKFSNPDCRKDAKALHSKLKQTVLK
jgi:hypothetical protein